MGLHLFPYRRRHGALCTCCASEPVQTGRVGLYNRQQLGFTPFCRLSSVIQPTIGWGYIFFRTAAATELVGLCKQHCLDAVYLGLYNRQKVGVTLFCRLSRVIQPTTGWGLHFFAGYLGLYNRQQVGVRLYPYRRRQGARVRAPWRRRHYCRRGGSSGGGGTEKALVAAVVAAYQIISNGIKCLHAYHMVVNVTMHVTWRSMSPCISHGVKCLHTYHTVVNVSMHVT